MRMLPLLLAIPSVLAHGAVDNPVGEHTSFFTEVLHYLNTNGMIIFGVLFVFAIVIFVIWLSRNR